MRRMCRIFVAFTRATGHPHPHLDAAFGNYQVLLEASGWSEAEIGDLFAELRAPVASVLAAREAPGQSRQDQTAAAADLTGAFRSSG